MPALPDGITLERNRDLRGLARTPWVRRALLCLIAVLPLLALLDFFGQKPSTTSAASPVASMSVTAPARLRGGLLFQAHVSVLARRPIRQLELAFDAGWWNSMGVNSIVPEPSSETWQDGKVVLTYGSLPAGGTLLCWMNFQVNATNVGNRREDVTLLDGSTQLLHIHRSLTIFP